MIDFKLPSCLNIKMSNTSKKNILGKNINAYLNMQANWRANRGNVHLLMKRLKKNKQKKNKEKLIFMMTVAGALVISGIISSF